MVIKYLLVLSVTCVNSTFGLLGTDNKSNIYSKNNPITV